MEEVQLNAELRDGMKKEFCKRMRKEGKLPAVIYGLKKDPISVTLEYREFYKMRMRTKDESSYINMSVTSPDGVSTMSAIVKDIQVHPVTGNALHVDFLEIAMENKAVFSVHLVFKNEDLAVKKSGGVLEHQMRNVHVKSLPKDVPDHIELDLAELEIGHAVHVRDLKSLVSDAVEIYDDGDKVVVGIAPKNQARDEDEVTEEVEETEESE